MKASSKLAGRCRRVRHVLPYFMGLGWRKATPSPPGFGLSSVTERATHSVRATADPTGNRTRLRLVGSRVGARHACGGLSREEGARYGGFEWPPDQERTIRGSYDPIGVDEESGIKIKPRSQGDFLKVGRIR